MIAIDKSFWQEKRVFITGHTGFKGAWLCLWLHSLGANVTGYALQPPTSPNLFDICRLDKLVESIRGDVRNEADLQHALYKTKPEIVVHMAAQPLVRESYVRPSVTYATNVMGTVNLLEAVRSCASVRVVVNVTTDKCYENREWVWGYRENEPLGGYDPYSSSKACSELVTASYRNSFFSPKDYKKHNVAIATARAGNVIGGGDWAKDRLIPDCINSLLENQTIAIRNPQAIRPWQHVLEPLGGYLLLAQKLYQEGTSFGESWNFGPCDSEAKSVEWMVKTLCEQWGSHAFYEIDTCQQLHEANYLKLDCSKANIRLGWLPKWDAKTALSKVVEWYKLYQQEQDMRNLCLHQIQSYGSREDFS